MLVNNNEIMDLKALEAFFEKCYNETLLLLYFYEKNEQVCQLMLTDLEKIIEGNVQIKLAKINVINNQTQQLAMQFRVSSLPTLLFIREKKIVKQLVDVQPIEILRQYIEALLPPPSQEIQLYDQVKLMFAEERYNEAYEYASMLYAQNCGNIEYLILLIRAAFRINNFKKAQECITLLPENYLNDKQNLNLLLKYLNDKQIINMLNLEILASQKIKRACEWLNEKKYEEACLALLESISFDKKYQEELAKNLLLAILFIMGPTKSALEIRKNLTNIMFI